jgi:PAS domain S-box-containing protein
MSTGERGAGSPQQSEERLNSLLETIPHGIQENDSSGIITYSNRAHHEMLGYEKGELIGMAIWDLIASEDERKTLKEYLNILVREQPPPTPYISKSLRKDGGLVDTQIEWNYVWDPEGNVTGFISVITDITEKKRTEDLLVASEERFSSIVRAAPMGIHIYECDESGRLVFKGANPAADTILGVDNRRFVGLTLEEAFPPLVETEVPERYRRTCLRGESWETEQIDYDDEKIRGAFHVHAFQTSPGRMAALFLDVTERRKMEEKLRESEEKFRMIFENAMDGMALVDVDTKRFLAMNESLRRALGYGPEELLNLGVDDVHPAEDLPRIREQFEKQLLGEIAVAEDIPMKRRDGSIFFADIASSPIRLGGSMCLVGSFRDITAHKEAEREKAALQAKIRQAQRMEAMGTLAGGIAHDFNNILGGILGYADLALMRSSDEAAVRSCMDEISRAVFQARDIVQRILMFSRQDEQQLRQMDIAPVVEEALKLARVSVPSSVDLRVDIDSGVGAVLADPSQIKQIMMNLCANAVHAMGEKGVLEISLTGSGPPPEAEMPGPHARISVKDTGAGMEPGVREKIFEPFFTTKEFGEGTGMGLSVVHGIIQACRGTILVESAPGEGTCFDIYLPLAVEDGKPEEEESRDVTRGSGRILFVDDDDLLLRLGWELLESLGYEVTLSNSGIEALEVFRARPGDFDLVITDQTMPSMTGADMAREMLRIRKDIPIVLCTGFTSVVTEEEAKASGIRDMVMKPLGRKGFAQVISRALGRDRDA